MRTLRPEASALLELGILFLPAIPAYIWLWPNVSETDRLYPVQSLAYVYVLGGALFIGLRRWTWDQLVLALVLYLWKTHPRLQGIAR